jgi:hypothetical protein
MTDGRLFRSEDMFDDINRRVLDKIKAALRDDECIISYTEINCGKSFHISLKYFGTGVDLGSAVEKVRRIYEEDGTEGFAGKSFLVIVEDDQESVFFVRDDQAPG